MFGLSVHHVGIACADIEAVADFIRAAYSIESDSGTVYDPLQKAYLRIFDVGGESAIELVSGPVVEKLLERKTSYYHICYATSDIEATLKQAKSCGAVVVSPPKPAVLFEGRRVAFVYTPLGLVEFLESTR